MAEVHASEYEQLRQGASIAYTVLLSAVARYFSDRSLGKISNLHRNCLDLLDISITTVVVVLRPVKGVT